MLKSRRKYIKVKRNRKIISNRFEEEKVNVVTWYPNGRKIKKSEPKPVINKKKKKSKFSKKYIEYLNSNEWIAIRIEMLTMFPFCQKCGSKKSLQVHHKTYKNVFNEEPKDLEVLCKSCHKAEHNIN